MVGLTHDQHDIVLFRNNPLAAPVPLVGYARTRRPILDVDLAADPFDRWREIGHRTVMTRFHRGGGQCPLH